MFAKELAKDTKRVEEWKGFYRVADVKDVLLTAADLNANTDFIKEIDETRLADLEDWACEDIGVEIARDEDYQKTFSFTSISLIDKLASDEVKALILNLYIEDRPGGDAHKLSMMQGQLTLLREEGRLLKKDARPHDIVHAINHASILGFDGGVPDFHVFAFKVLCSECGQAIRDRIRSGGSIGIGRSAGAMILVGDVFSNEPSPWIWPSLIGAEQMTGLAVLGGGISVRPHFNNQKGAVGVKCMALYDYAEVAQRDHYPRKGGGVITIPNDSGVTISGGSITWIDGSHPGRTESLVVMQNTYTVFDHGLCKSALKAAHSAACHEFKRGQTLPLLPSEINDLREVWRNCDRYSSLIEILGNESLSFGQA